jgi:hypothetical protein
LLPLLLLGAAAAAASCLDEVSHVGGQLLNDGVVEALDVL